MSFVTRRTPVSAATSNSAAARSVAFRTTPVRMTSPFAAVAATPTGAASFSVSASFAAVVSSVSSRTSPGGSRTSRPFRTFLSPAIRRASAVAARYCG